MGPLMARPSISTERNLMGKHIFANKPKLSEIAYQTYGVFLSSHCLEPIAIPIQTLNE